MGKLYPIGIQNFELISQWANSTWNSAVSQRKKSNYNLQRITHEETDVQAFAADKRKIFKIGINFSNETRNIEKWIVE